MNLVLSVTVGLVFAAGIYMMLRRDLVRTVNGSVLISSAAVLFLMAAGRSRGRAPLYPLARGEPASDPLVQALALTSLVISFGISIVAYTLVYRFFATSEDLEEPGIQTRKSRRAGDEQPVQEPFDAGAAPRG